MDHPSSLVVIAGPTAAGKTALSIDIAKHFHTEIISFDSRQCYRELNIGVAKPTTAELSGATHSFINSHAIQQPVDVAGFESYALNVLDNVFTKTRTAVAVGGTGLYMKALCEGIDEMPAVPENIRINIRAQYEKNGLEWLQQALMKADPVYASDGEMQNPHRLLRALEIITASGKSIRTFQQKKPVARNFNIIKIGMELPRELLVGNIHRRVDAMMEAGLLEEVKQLIPFRHLQALQTVGYTELFEYFDGSCTLAEAIEKIKTNTRQYAKRQMTWFKKDQDIIWFDARYPNQIIEYVSEKLRTSQI